MQVFITGVSKGLGKALTEHFLEKGDQVIGIGRSHSFEHENFRFIECDLSNLDAVSNHSFGKLGDEILFINNAGIIGNIERISEQEKSDIIPVLSVNSIAPMLLCQKLLQVAPIDYNITIINISSGAGRRAIPSWAAYCASKAAIDLFSLTLYQEELERQRSIQIYSVAPGVIDTQMQEKIRSSEKTHFSSVEDFIDLKENDQLLSVETVVNKLIKLLTQEFTGNVICSLKDL